MKSGNWREREERKSERKEVWRPKVVPGENERSEERWRRGSHGEGARREGETGERGQGERGPLIILHKPILRHNKYYTICIILYRITYSSSIYYSTTYSTPLLILLYNIYIHIYIYY